MSEDDVEVVMRHPLVMIGSDGLPAGDKPHPRVGHTYPRVLGEYVRRRGLLDLATAVHRMTSMPARRFGLVDRGELRAGAFADLVLFDPATIVDTGTYVEPGRVPAGIVGVWVNGEQVAHEGEHTGARPGRVLRHP
jgi:N-acyl-D-amino-acid deacylase